jgi:hypothetical protein
MPRSIALIAAFLVAGCVAAGPMAAYASTPDDEPPLIAGRVAVADGDAQIWRVEENNTGQWDRAVINDVISVGTGLYTGDDGRYEVRVGPHTFRLGADSRGGFSQLDYVGAVFNLEYGALNVRLAQPGHGETSFVTASGARLELRAPGRYRVDVTDRGPVRLTVFEGHGTMNSNGVIMDVASGQAVVVNPGVAGISYEQAVSTEFDQWALARDDRYRDVRSAQYVSPYMTGYEDLDAYGEWVPDVTYGTVWYPRVVPVGWAPYRYGQWRWVRPWGWTWVDNAPWGYAPFHYGRWVTTGGRWCWVPGGFVRRPVWAPALVGFVGTNVSVSVAIGGPVVGWYPLAPWSRYEPHYRHSPTYVTVINRTVISRPPPGVPRTVNQGPGATMVPGPRFREPVMKVALPERPRPADLRPVAPPPANVAPAPRPSTRKFPDSDHRGAPVEREAPPVPPAHPGQPSRPGSPPTRVTPPVAAEPVHGRGVTPQPPLPGNDRTPLAQPPGLNRGQPAGSPPPFRPSPAERVQPRPRMPSDQIPPGQSRPVNPAEPARTPPGAPPTIRQPMAPGARPVQTAPGAAHARPVPHAAPSAPSVAQPPARPAPPHREQAPRNVPEQERGKPEREAPRPKSMER